MKKGYLIDLDGTIFKGNQPCTGAITLVNRLIEKQIPFVFFTNNSSRTRWQLRQHMEMIGFTGIREEHFFTSSMATSRYIAKHYDKKKVFAIGELGLMEELVGAGFDLVEENADFVVIGMDRNGTYQQYTKAMQEVLKGAILIGTNNDRRLPDNDGYRIGNGAVVALLEYATDKESIKIGKPHLPMVETALEYLNLDRTSSVIVGDNLETDIQCGLTAGIDTVLVLGGVHGVEDCHRLHIQPDGIIHNLTELMLDE